MNDLDCWQNPAMPAPQNYHDFPLPDISVRDRNRLEKGPQSALTVAKSWRPSGASTIFEVAIATLCRFALRLVDRTTGRAYSADELEAKILEQVDTTILELEEAPVDAVEGVAASLLFFFTEPTESFQIVSLAENFGEPDIYVSYSVDETFLSPTEAAAYVVTNWPEESNLAASHTTPPSAFVRITCKDIGVGGNDYAFDTPGGPINGLPANLTGGVDAVTGTPGTTGQIAIHGEDAYICVRPSPALWKLITPE